MAPDASTRFFRSKARGEAALRDAGVRTVTLRPTLVLAPEAYGGTAMLRAAAALPFVLPNVLPRSQVQCVHIDDLTRAVSDAASGRIAPGAIVDVTGPDTQTIPELLRLIRRWQGFAAPWVALPLPGWLTRLVGRAADLAGLLGWRASLRTTAIRVLAEGVTGDAESLVAAGGTPCRTTWEALAALPSTTQESWFARAYALFPLAVVTLSAFWMASGAIGLARLAEAQTVLTARGWSHVHAGLAVVLGSTLDLALGALLLWRSKLKRAAIGMIAVSLAYLAGGTIFAPDLWADPLGPLVKVIPGIALTFFVLALADDR